MNNDNGFARASAEYESRLFEGQIQYDIEEKEEAKDDLDNLKYEENKLQELN